MLLTFPRKRAYALFGRGHRRIGMVYGCSWPGRAVRERFRAYCDAHTRAGFAVEIGLMLNGGYAMEAAAEATRALLALPEPPTAILYWSDLMAIAGMDAARVFPRLSSIRQEKQGTGAAMAARLIDRIEGVQQGPAERIGLPTSFVERDSVAPVRDRAVPGR